MNIDLRATVEQTLSARVYDQGRTNACGGYAVKTDMECLRELAGLPFRPVSAQWIYNRAREFAGTLDVDNGSGQAELSKVLEIGFLFEDQFDPSLPRPSAQDATAHENGAVRVSTGWIPGTDSLAGIKRSIAMGLPVIIAIPVGESLWAGIRGDDWRQHNPTIGDERNTHWCAVVGFDDAAERILVEDSSGPQSWDGGFFGLPYSLISASGYLKAAWRIEHIKGVPIKINDIGEQAETILTKRDIGQWFDAHKTALTADVRDAYLAVNQLNFYSLAKQGFEAVRGLLLSAGVIALQNDGIPGLLVWCRANGITDLMLEVLAAWNRGAVRRYFDAESLDIALIEWAPL